uniref:Uncharacterized protein n=1 Tax=Meloidogyne enterolobii TaxID=390850 RepID=A0A6V7USB1_MELEN|nr:unnamed protein product [Meloidogyne enterolobii]
MVLITNFLKSTFYNISKGMHLVLFYMKFFTEEGSIVLNYKSTVVLTKLKMYL